MKNKMKKDLEIKVAVLYERFDRLDAQLAEIKNNHLAHLAAQMNKFEETHLKLHDSLNKDLSGVRNKMAYYSGGIATLFIILNVLYWVAGIFKIK